MNSVGERYQERIGKLTNKRATWEPGDQLALGDVGVEESGLFRVETTLQKLGIVWQSKRGKVVPQESKSSVKWSVNSASAAADVELARVDLELEFEDSGAVVFEARDLRHIYIDDLHTVAQAIVERHRAGEWNKEWMLVDQIWRADVATVLVAAVGGTKVGIVGGLPSLRSFVDADVQYSLEQRSGELNRYERLSDATLLYTCRRLNWTGRKVKALSRGAASTCYEDDATELSLEPVAWDDILSSWV